MRKEQKYITSKKICRMKRFREWIIIMINFFIFSAIQLYLLKNKFWEDYCLARCTHLGVLKHKTSRTLTLVSFFLWPKTRIAGETDSAVEPQGQFLYWYHKLKAHAIYSRRHSDSSEGKQYLHKLRQIGNRMTETEVSFFSSD